MKEIKHISFNEILLIPAKNRFENSEYPYSHYKGHICGENGRDSTTVHINLFNCFSKNEIPSIVDLEIKDLQNYISENPHVEEVKTQLEFFLKLKDDLDEAAFYHTPSDELIQFISEKCLPEVKKENVIFLSGILNLIEG